MYTVTLKSINPSSITRVVDDRHLLCLDSKFIQHITQQHVDHRHAIKNITITIPVTSDILSTIESYYNDSELDRRYSIDHYLDMMTVAIRLECPSLCGALLEHLGRMKGTLDSNIKVDHNLIRVLRRRNS